MEPSRFLLVCPLNRILVHQEGFQAFLSIAKKEVLPLLSEWFAELDGHKRDEHEDARVDDGEADIATCRDRECDALR